MCWTCGLHQVRLAQLLAQEHAISCSAPVDGNMQVYYTRDCAIQQCRKGSRTCGILGSFGQPCNSAIAMCASVSACALASVALRSISTHQYLIPGRTSGICELHLHLAVSPA